MESDAALAIIRAVQIPLGLLASLHLDEELWPPTPIVENNTCFDYIIAGGGTAGMVVARRLTEDKGINVLVIEAGDDPPLEALLALFFVTLPLSAVDWNFTSTFDSYAASSQNNRTKLTSGRMLGGSSCMDHFIHVRGAPYDFDNWAEITGDPTWRYENVLPYFKKSEHLEDTLIEKSPYATYHGIDGPMGVTREPRFSANPYLVSFGEAGNRVVLDVNGPNTLGYTQSMYTNTGGIRQCTAWSYIHPVKDRKNLFVLRNTYVTKIIFDDYKRAVAVEALMNNKTYVFRASREIIVCTGVYKTPQLLMLSGIGPQSHLESFNINVVSNLPVGNNFQDQITVTLLHRTDNSIVDPVVPLPTIVPFPVLVGIVALNKTQSYGDYQVFGIIVGQDTPNLILACRTVFGYRPEICDIENNGVLLHNSIYSLITLLHPDSRGHIRLNSTNPLDKPLIRTGYYDKATDIDQMISYIRNYLDVEYSTFFTEFNATFIDPVSSECMNYTYRSDEYWRCYVLHMTVSAYHTSSTCPMGAVVDGRLRVHGVSNLRVVDASVMPNVPHGSPHAVVIMIAEKASDMIKEEADKHPSCAELRDACEDVYPIEDYQKDTVDTKIDL